MSGFWAILTSYLIKRGAIIKMKAKLIIVLLIGLLIGTLLGGILVPAMADGYSYQLDDIYSILSDIADDVSDIEYRVRQIYWEMY